ncbi:polymorphic toxin type 5 domain-containing protein [Phormidesmis sp. 146-33]
MSAADLMARIDAARNRQQSARDQLTGIGGAFIGIGIVNEVGIWMSSNSTSHPTYVERSDSNRISSRNRRTFMDEQRRIIQNDPLHPLRRLLNDQGEWRGRDYGRPSEHTVGQQAGHLTSRHGLQDGELERFAVEDGYLNQTDAYGPSGESGGVILDKTALDIGGVPVEARTARMYAELGYIDESVVRNAPTHPGWNAPRSLFDEVPATQATNIAEGGLTRVQGAGRALGLLGVGLDAYSLYEAYEADGGRFGEEFKTTAGGVVGGIAGGAAMGAAIGTLVPVPIVGTVIGGLIGGILGSMAGETIGEAL